MKFDTNLNAVPYNHPLLLNHRDYGVGIGSVRKISGVPGVSVSFATVKDTMGHSGVAMPSPVEITDIVSWADYPDDKPDPVHTYNHGKLTSIIEQASFASTYGDMNQMTEALGRIAVAAKELLAETA